MKFILALFSLFVVGLSQSADPCAPQCRFKLCQADGLDTITDGPRLQVRPSGIVSIPFVCLKTAASSDILGRVIKTAPSFVANASESRDDNLRTYSKISQYKRGTISPKFKNFFYGLDVLNSPMDLSDKYGIRRQRARGNQGDFLNDLCVRIPIRRYVDISTGKTVRAKGATDCVAFRTIKSFLLVDLVWDSSDDLDLRIMTPTGIFSEFNVPAGAKFTRSTQVTCGPATAARELASYQRIPPPVGMYTVQVRVSTKCPTTTTTFTARAIRHGESILGEETRSVTGTTGFVTVFTFPI